MIDFLTFKTFITPSLLVVMYVTGAVVIPFGSYYAGKWLLTRYFSRQKEQFYAVTTVKQRIGLLVLFMGCFVCMEIMWRMMFEFVVAYFDMHAALMKLQEGSVWLCKCSERADMGSAPTGVILFVMFC